MKYYKINFNAQGVNPSTFSGLGASVSIIKFYSPVTGQTYAPPGMSENFAGSGDYWFRYDIGQTTSISFLVDGGATLSASVRYVGGIIDPNDNLSAQIGYTGSSIGSTSVDPGDLFGYVKRAMELSEGNQTFIKSSGQWAIYDRGASTLLRMKTLTSSTTGVTSIP